MSELSELIEQLRAKRPSRGGWVLRSDNSMAPANEEQDFRQAEVMDIVDFATFIKRATPPTPQERDIDITRAASRESTSHIDISDSRTWHS